MRGKLAAAATTSTFADANSNKCSEETATATKENARNISNSSSNNDKKDNNSASNNNSYKNISKDER